MSEYLLDAKIGDFVRAVGARTPEAFVYSLRTAVLEHQMACGHRPQDVTVTDAAHGAEFVMGLTVRYAPIEPGVAIVSNLGYQTEVTW